MTKIQSLPMRSGFTVELRVLLRNFAGTLGRQLLAAIVQLLTVVIVARQFGAAGSGVYAVSLLLPALLVTLLNIGAYTANVYFLGTSKFSVQQIWFGSLKLTAGLSFLGITATSVLIHFAGNKAFPGVDPTLLWISLIIFPISLLHGFQSSIFQGLQRFKEFNISILAQPVVTALLIGVAAVLNVTELVYLVAANLIGAISAMVLSYWLLRPWLGKQATMPETAYFTKLFSYGFKAHASNVLTFIHNRADLLIINTLIGPAAAGVYVIAVQLCEKLWMLSHAVSAVLFPRLSELGSNEGKRVQLTSITSRLVFGVSALGAMTLAIIAYPFITVLFGWEYRDAYMPLLILLPGVVAISSSRVIANDIAARGRPELNMYMAFVALVANLTADVLLIPILGITGAALAATLSYSLDLLMKICIYKMITKASLSSLVIIRSNDLKELLSAVKKKGPETV